MWFGGINDDVHLIHILDYFGYYFGYLENDDLERVISHEVQIQV